MVRRVCVQCTLRNYAASHRRESNNAETNEFRWEFVCSYHIQTYRIVILLLLLWLFYVYNIKNLWMRRWMRARCSLASFVVYCVLCVRRSFPSFIFLSMASPYDALCTALRLHAPRAHTCCMRFTQSRSIEVVFPTEIWFPNMRRAHRDSVVQIRNKRTKWGNEYLSIFQCLIVRERNRERDRERGSERKRNEHDMKWCESLQQLQ